MDTASNVAVRHRLPETIHLLIKDKVNDRIYGSFAGINYFDDGSGQLKITRTAIGELMSNAKISEIADLLITHNPGTALVCDSTIFELLKNEPTTTIWLEDRHFRLTGRPGGVLDVYYTYDAESSPNAIAPGIHKQTYKK